MTPIFCQLLLKTSKYINSQTWELFLTFSLHILHLSHQHILSTPSPSYNQNPIMSYHIPGRYITSCLNQTVHSNCSFGFHFCVSMVYLYLETNQIISLIRTTPHLSITLRIQPKDPRLYIIYPSASLS